MKINKEEMFGMYAALKSYIERDHEKEWQDWLDRIHHILSHLASIPGVKGEVYIGPGPANAFPSLNITWDQDQIKTTPKDVLDALKDGTPSIIANGTAQVLNVGVVLLRPEQVNIVARRLKEILVKARSRK
jgi:L-seryl-tRNA(Ser) seleniumtransferase